MLSFGGYFPIRYLFHETSVTSGETYIVYKAQKDFIDSDYRLWLLMPEENLP